jgi:hypothetical protein
MFSRSLGSAIGAAVFGAISNATLASQLAHPPSAVAGQLPHCPDAASLVLVGDVAVQRPAVTAFLRQCLQSAAHHVFIAQVAVGMLLAVAALLVMPRQLALAQPDSTQADAAELDTTPAIEMAADDGGPSTACSPETCVRSPRPDRPAEDSGGRAPAG